MSRRPCPTCGTITEEGRCSRHPRSADRYRPRRSGLATYRNPIYQALRYQVLVASGFTCAYCAGPATTADHVLPRSRGGRTVRSNLLPACSTCNTSKGDRTVVEWVRSGCAPVGARQLLDRRVFPGQEAAR